MIKFIAGLMLGLMVTGANAQVMGSCSVGSIAWTNADPADCLHKGGVYTLPGQTGLPIAGQSMSNISTSISSYAPKCPDGYTLVYTGRPMCAKDLREPE